MLSYCVLSTEGTDTCSPSKEASGGWTWMDGRRVREEVLWEGPDRGVRVLAGVFVAPFFRCHRKCIKVEKKETCNKNWGVGWGCSIAQGSRIRLKDPQLCHTTPWLCDLNQGAYPL